MLRFVLVLVLPLLSGCIFVGATVTPPQQLIGAGLSGGNQRRVVVLGPFFDARPIRNRCGMKKNNYNFDTADVVCSAEPAHWLAELFVDELRASGFDVARSPSSEPNEPQIRGELLQFFIEPKMNYWDVDLEADVHIRLVVSSPSGLNAERDFYVKTTKNFALEMEGEFQETSDKAVRLVVRNMVAAILELLGRYPDLGVRLAKAERV